MEPCELDADISWIQDENIEVGHAHNLTYSCTQWMFGHKNDQNWQRKQLYFTLKLNSTETRSLEKLFFMVLRGKIRKKLEFDAEVT